MNRTFERRLNTGEHLYAEQRVARRLGVEFMALHAALVAEGLRFVEETTGNFNNNVVSMRREASARPCDVEDGE